MFDPDNILAVALEALAMSGLGPAKCDRLHCNDTIGPCAACPIRFDNPPGLGDEVT